MEETYQKNISDLPNLESYRYENIFKVSSTTDGYYFYNLIKKITIPEDIDPQYYFTYSIQSNTPMTTLSYQVYGTIYLWWLICATNKLTDPMGSDLKGKTIKIIKREYVKQIVDSITSQLQ